MHEPWRVSLHGGHSGQFCDHAQGTLRDVLEAAVAFGYHTFGVSEHAPRGEDRFLYAEEIEMGWDNAYVEDMFRAYQDEVWALCEEFQDRLIVLRGFEGEVVPTETYAERMREYRARGDWDFMVGSVHHVHETIIDGTLEDFSHAMDLCGGLEELAVTYYRTLAEMIDTLQPEVVGHFDLIRKRAGSFGPVDTPRARRAAEEALDVARQHDCILDLNTAGYRKNLATPYPAPWLVQRADRMGLGFCFGDDSHGPSDVGLDVERGRLYLLEQGVRSVRILTREGGEVVRKRVPLDD